MQRNRPPWRCNHQNRYRPRNHILNNPPRSNHNNPPVWIPSNTVVETFEFAFLQDKRTVDFIRKQGRIVFIIFITQGDNGLIRRMRTTYISGVICAEEVRRYELYDEGGRQWIERVEAECRAGTHPIIIIPIPNNSSVSATNFLQIAESNGYTVIVNQASRILGMDNSNLKNLIPTCLGWFLFPDQIHFLLDEVQQVLELLLKDGKFCKTFNAYSKEKLLSTFTVESQVCCIASYITESKFGIHKNKHIQNANGKYFELPIVGFVVGTYVIMAVIIINKDLELVMTNDTRPGKKKDNSSSLVVKNKNVVSKTLAEVLANHLVQQIQYHRKEMLLDVNRMNFMVIANAKTNIHVKQPRQFAQEIFRYMKNNHEIIDKNAFRMFDDGTKYSRLPNDMWFVPLNQAAMVPAMFKIKYC